jgi:hypothetical protein
MDKLTSGPLASPVPAAPTKPPVMKPVAAVQESLPLSPATDLEAKEVYVWDESKGID